MGDRKKAIVAMHKGGLTYDEIGQMMGVSRQRVHQIANKGTRDGFRAGAVEKIPYVGLRNWMLENRVGVTELKKRCGAKSLDLSGTHNMRADRVSKVLEVTGLLFHECFRRDDNG